MTTFRKLASFIAAPLLAASLIFSAISPASGKIRKQKAQPQPEKVTNALEGVSVTIGEAYESPFLNRVGVFQDGTVPLCRDAEGNLWGISGHSHMGHIGMFRGTSLDDMKEAWPITLNFTTGDAEYAFAGIRYPEGVKARGSIWPFGLYICPVTGRFFCFFHNETGWNGHGTAYDAFGQCVTPAFDSDFRHIGLMHSDDQGQTWTFDRWVVTSETVCFTDKYNPGAGNMIGQPSGIINLGAGDFSLFIEPDGDYIYLFYNMVKLDMDRGWFHSVDTYVARTRKRTDGVMGDFVKYFDGAFCEPGNFGRETAVANNTWHSRVAYSEALKCYLMASSPVAPKPEDKPREYFAGVICDFMQVRTSTDLIHWSEPVSFMDGDHRFGNHYQAIISSHGSGDPAVIPASDFTVMECHNGTDVMCHDFHLDFNQNSVTK